MAVFKAKTAIYDHYLTKKSPRLMKSEDFKTYSEHEGMRIIS